MRKIIIEVHKGMATVVTKKLWLPESHGRKGEPAIGVEVRDYDIEGGVYDEDVVRRGYSREITGVAVQMARTRKTPPE